MSCATACLLIAWAAAFAGFLAGSWCRGLKQARTETLTDERPQ